MSYIYILLVVGYYLYKAYASNKKKQMENAAPFPEQSTTQNPSKKGFFDEILEELEKAQKSQQPATSTPPASVVQQKSTPKKVTKTVYEPTILEQTNFSPEEEGQRITVDTPTDMEDKKDKKWSRGFAGMKMSPKEALKAQIILERKF